jgi:hypothetical protein
MKRDIKPTKVTVNQKENKDKNKMGEINSDNKIFN